MADILNAGAEPVNEPSLRETIAAEWEKASAAPDAAAPVAATPVAPTEPQETEAEKAERLRDPLGRFASKEAAAAATALTDAAAPPVDDKTVPDAEKEGEAKVYAGPPPGWSVSAKAAYDQLPDEVKASIGKREQEIDRGFAKLKDFKAIEAQHAPTAQQYGVPLPEFINRLADADKFLQREPLNAIKWLCDTYRIDPRALLGEAAQQNGAAPQQQQYQPANDAALEPLMRELNGLKQIVYGDKRTQVTNQVDSFFADPKNKYSENVADQMVVLINEAKRAGQPVDLPAIYDTACYMNPEVRTALIKEQSAKQQMDQAAKAKQAANQARQAGASITGGPAATPPPVSPDLDLRSLLEQNYAALSGRT